MTPPTVVVHLDEREKVPLVLNNVKNLIDGLEGVEVEVVAHAGGVEGLRTGTSHAALVEELATGGSGSSSARTPSAPGASRATIFPGISRSSRPRSWNWSSGRSKAGVT